MKRIFSIIGVLALAVIAGAVYFQPGGNPQGKRDYYLNKARGYISQAKVKEAVIEFRNALKADPTFAESHHELGSALLKLGERERALQEFRRAAELKPDMMEPRYQLASLYLLAGDVRRAKEQLNEIQKFDPDSVEVRQIAAQVALAEKAPDKAVMELEEALKKEPNKASLYVDIASIYAGKKDFKRAGEFYRKALDIDPALIEPRVALPRLYLAMGNQTKAEEELILATRAAPENENLLHIRASDYAGTGKFDEFEKLYQDLLKKKPDSLMAKKRLAEFYILKGDLEKGWAYTHAIAKARPGDPDATYFYGRLHLAQKEWARAAEVLSYATQEAPSFAFAHYFLGVALFANNHIAQAQMAFAKALELNPLWLEPRLALARGYLTTGAYDLAWRESEPILLVQPRNFDVLMVAGTARLKKGEAGPALELLHRAKEINRSDASLRSNIGAAYVVQKKYGQALTEYEEALKLDADKIDALSAVAQVLSLEGNQKAAAQRVQQQLDKAKNKAEVYQLLGQLSVDQKDFDKAISYFEKAIALKPDLFSAAHLMARSYMAQKKFDQAIVECDKIIQRNPKATESYMLLGVLYDQKQQYDQANSYYKKVMELDKNSALAANNLAWNYGQYGGNLDVALPLAQKARELSPNDENIAHTLGWIYYKRGVYLRAIDLLKESSEKFQDRNPTVLYHLGLAYAKKGDTTRAQESLSKALRLDPNFREAKKAKQALDETGAERD